jgi:hypothetical protein
MKIMKFFVSLAYAIVFSAIIGGLITAFTGLPPAFSVGGLFLASFIPHTSAGVLMDSVLVEVWTGEMLNHFRSDPSWINDIPSRDELVNNNVIHLVDVGADPDVLINNTTYPIAVVSREDEDVAISLDKFDTENTSVTDDELYAISYDKMSSVITQHKEVLEEKTADKAAHALAPSVSTDDTPIVLSTGASNGETAARKRLTPKDIIRLKKKMDDLKVPKKGRILILCNEHVQDLLIADEVFEKQYQSITDGKVLNMYGFKIYEYATMPIYKETGGVLTKKAFGAAADSTNDHAASIAFYPQRAFKCKGDLKMYFSEAAGDPEFRRNLVGFRLWDICLPKKWIGFAALVSAKHTQ